jgi:endonuclease/exonuclease/phosphatase family metal-dependent hydrolase
MDVNMKFLALTLFFVAQQAIAGWTLSTFNIRNFDHDRDAGPTNIAELRRLIQETKSDVMTFQEVVNIPAFQNVVASNLPDYQIVRSDCGGFGKQNLAVVFNKAHFELVSKEEDLSFTGKDGTCGSLRPVMIVTLKQKATQQEYIFAVVHLKAGGDARSMQTRWGQYNRLKSLVAKYQKKKIILLGDFNTTGYNQGNEDFTKFEEFLSSARLRTSAEEVSCTNYWHGGDQDPSYISSVLDHILMQDSVHAGLRSVRVASHCQKNACRPAMPGDLGVSFASVSDHCPVQVTFK